MVGQVEEEREMVDAENKRDGEARETKREGEHVDTKEQTEAKPRVRRYLTKHMKLYPELYRSDVSIHPSYTTLKNLPYYVVCRRRVQKTKRQIRRQLNRDIMHFAMMQMFAIDSVKNGYIRRVTDDEVKSLALEIAGTNVTTTYIFCPRGPKKALGIKLPFLIMIIKNMKKYFTFEITILDDKDMHRRFRMSNFQSTTRVRPFCTSMPIGLSGGWNQIQFNLADFTRRALYAEDELPEDFKLFLPIHRKKCVREKDVKKEEKKEREIEEIEIEKPPPFEAGDVAEEAEEKAEELGEDELIEEEAIPVEDLQKKVEIRDEDEEEQEEEDEDEEEADEEEEEEEDEELAEIGEYDAEDEGDEPEEHALPITTPGYATEEETDAEQTQGDEDEEYVVQ
ncbi:hypothetical protein WN48_10457 [Eufriesea mexicana]|uniref:CFA20 domain-containing protein n=1 Tax=Eufriesea mexicana TaxID=516756 RepID=A0A310S6J2_9HYME|nr:hypothetical protein WN48_10457 [Eufriesea mexicana]